MRILLIVFLLIGLKDASGQDSTIHYLKEVGWTIQLPLDFKVLSVQQNSTIANKGKKEIEETLDTTVNILETINLISARKSNNYFSATLTRNQSKDDNNSAKFIKSQEETIYTAMSKDAKVDSSSTTINIGGQVFRKFQMTVHINDKSSFGMNLATRLYKGYYFVLAYVFLDEATKAEIENMLVKSTFTK